MAWIKSDQSLANHPKLILLARELGITKVKALGHLHLLWYWVLEYAEDGYVKYLDLIPDACEWEEDGKIFLDALIKYEFIDESFDVEMNRTEYIIHDWLDYSGAFFEKKLYNRVKKQESREKLAENYKKPNEIGTLTYFDKSLTKIDGQDLEESRVEESRVDKSREEYVGLATQDNNSSKRDMIFETLAEVCGYDWKGVMTKDERGRLNKAVKQLKDIKATPEDIQLRAKNFVMAYGFHPQPQSITSMWTKLKSEQPKLTKKQLEDLQKQAIQSGKWVELEEKYGK
jgi:hypothetical protein